MSTEVIVTGPDTADVVTVGIQGPTGATGAAGPNTISTATATAFTGLVKGNGSVCSDVAVTAFVLTIFDDADAATARSTLGAAAASHAHSGADVTSGTVAEARIDAAIARLASPEFSGTVTMGSSLTVTHTGTHNRFADPSANGIQFVTLSGTRGAEFLGNGGLLVPIVSGTYPNIGSANIKLAGTSGGITWATDDNSITTTVDVGIKKASARVVELNNGTAGGAGATVRSVPLTPAQITADADNYNPGVARFYRLSTDASRTVTGLAVGQVDGQECEVWNAGSNNLVLAHDATSTAANRFLCTGAANITLAANEVALLRYDNTAARWRARKV